MVVLLPAPLGPSRPTISPRLTVNEMFETAVWPAYRLVKLATSIIEPALMNRHRVEFSGKTAGSANKISGLRRSADWQSAVLQAGSLQNGCCNRRRADCQSASRQTDSLRYGPLPHRQLRR